MFDPGPCVYMEKMAGGPDIADLLSLDDPIEDVLAPDRGASAACAVGDLMVVHPRPAATRGDGRAASAAPARASASSPTATSPARCWPRATAPASTCCGASAARPRACSPRPPSSASAATILGRLWPRDEGEASRARAAGYDLDRMLHRRPRRAATTASSPPPGVTDGDLLDGVRYDRGGAIDPVDRHARTLRHGAHRATPGTTARSCARSPASATAEPT